MNKDEIKARTQGIIAEYDSGSPQPAANALRAYWLTFEPKSTAGVKAEQRAEQDHAGTPVDVLRVIGGELGKAARKAVPDFVPLARILWDEYGREGRIVAAVCLGPMQLADPERIFPLLLGLARTCHTWEDADQLAMNAVEPVVRKFPEAWLAPLEPWLADDNKWVRRIAITVVGRLAMKRGDYAPRCLVLAERLLLDPETDVKRAVSFAIRLTAKGDAAPVRDFLARHVPPDDPAATWVLCDTIRSMAKRLLPEFVALLPVYEAWAGNPALDGTARRSVASAVSTLRNAAES
ncbi:MAG: DNA alkylation repair protein [Chloroflexi bacterium]|nr:DNA alkylation repair protein [Chloroflexota bacterium]